MRTTHIIGLIFISILFLTATQTNAQIAYGNEPVVDKPLIQIEKQPSEESAKIGTNITISLNITNWSANKTAYNLTITEPLLSDWTVSSFNGWDEYIWLEVGPSGSISYEYSIVMKKVGNYEIGASIITYYDENGTEYTSKSQSMTIEIYETEPPLSQDRLWRNITIYSLGILLLPIGLSVLNQILWRKE